MLRHLRPKGDVVLEELLVDAGERPEPEEKAVAILLGERRGWRPRGGRQGGLRARMAEARKKAEHVRQGERAVVMEIFADAPVPDGRLLGCRVERGVGI